jgi:hypothetical protein
VLAVASAPHAPLDPDERLLVANPGLADAFVPVPVISFTGDFAPPLVLPHARCPDARAAVAAHLKCEPPAVMVVSRGTALADRVPLDADSSYRVKLAKFLIVSVLPKKPPPRHRRIERAVPVPPEIRTVADLVRAVLPPPLDAKSARAVVGGKTLPAKHELALMPDGAALQFVHKFACVGHFSFKGEDRDGTTELKIDASTTVNEIKSRLSRDWAWPRLLSTLVLRYFDASTLGAYGIPERSTLELGFLPCTTVGVSVNGGAASAVAFSDTDTVGHLRAFLAGHFLVDGFASRGRPIADADALAAVAEFGVQAAVSKRPADARPQTMPPPIAFRFGGRPVQIALDRRRPLAELRPLIAKALGIHGPIAVFSRGKKVDDGLALNDGASDLPDLTIELAPANPTRS